MKAQMQIDYDIDDTPLHKARVLMGDPVAEQVDVVLKYAERVNRILKSKGADYSHSAKRIIQVANQSINLAIYARYAMAIPDCQHETEYLPTTEESNALSCFTRPSSINHCDLFYQENRLTGATTVKALEEAANLLKNGGKWVEVDGQVDDIYLISRIQQILKQLGISFQERSHRSMDSMQIKRQIQTQVPNRPRSLK